MEGWLLQTSLTYALRCSAERYVLNSLTAKEVTARVWIIATAPRFSEII